MREHVDGWAAGMQGRPAPVPAPHRTCSPASSFSSLPCCFCNRSISLSAGGAGGVAGRRGGRGRRRGREAGGGRGRGHANLDGRQQLCKRH